MNEMRDQSLRMLNRGGKKIDMQHSQKQTIVGAHMINENSHEPSHFERGLLDRASLVPAKSKLLNDGMPSHITLGKS